MGIPLLITIPLSLFILASLRALYILRRVDGSRAGISQPPSSQRTAHILISLGSGGHTAEMLALLSSPALPTTRYTRRTYVISSGDSFSAEKAREFEAGLLPAVGQDGRQQQQQQQQQQTTTTPAGEGENPTRQRRGPAAAPAHPRGGGGGGGGGYEIHTVPRARRIHQPLHTTPWTCLLCLWSSTRILLGRAPPPPPPQQNDDAPPVTTTTTSSTEHHQGRWGRGKPDLILLNGPATSLVLVLASLLIRFFSVIPRSTGGEMRTIYIESWARVRTPSLTLRIISSLRLCDRVVVQHRPLARAGWGEWRGDLMR